MTRGLNNGLNMHDKALLDVQCWVKGTDPSGLEAQLKQLDHSVPDLERTLETALFNSPIIQIYKLRLKEVD